MQGLAAPRSAVTVLAAGRVVVSGSFLVRMSTGDHPTTFGSSTVWSIC
jgi:hypothetical protein